MTDVQTTAAIWGAIFGALTGGVVSAVAYFAYRYVGRRIGNIEFDTPSDWNFAYLEWMRPQRYAEPDGPERVEYEIRRRPPGRNYTAEERGTGAWYRFTAHLRNGRPPAVVLRDVRVAFMKDGQRVFDTYPIDEEDDDPVVVNLIEKARYSTPSFGQDEVNDVPQPGMGIDPKKVIQIPADGGVTIKLRGYVFDTHGADFKHLQGGCDEVRLRGELWPRNLLRRKDFDEHIVSIKTAPHQFPEDSGRSGWIYG